MPKSVNLVAAKARRKKILKAAKGYFGRRKNVHTVAKNAVEKAMQYAYRDRKNKKRTYQYIIPCKQDHQFLSIQIVIILMKFIVRFQKWV